MVKSHRWSILAVVIILIGCVMVAYLWYSQVQEPFSTGAQEIQVIQLNPDAFEGNHAFNPSIIFYNDSTYSNTIDEIEPGKTNLILTYRSQPEQFHSDTKLIVKEKNTLTYQDNHQLSISLDASNKTYDYNDDFKYEDARFVILNQTPYLNYTSITRNRDGGITSIKNKLCEYQHPKHTAHFESLNSLQGIQKNWILFEYNGETFIIYELLPHLKVFRRGNDDDDLQLVTDQLYTTAPEIRGGTSPIILDDKLYIFGHCSVQGASTTTQKEFYHLSVVVLRYDGGGGAFVLDSYCENLLEDAPLDAKYVFCRGALFVKSLNKFILSVGVDDKYPFILAIDKHLVDAKNKSITYI
jgi:hypothetical protein